MLYDTLEEKVYDFLVTGFSPMFIFMRLFDPYDPTTLGVGCQGKKNN